MLITKFNRMIHNRVVWAIVGGTVALSMVWFVGPSGSCSPSDESSQSEGSLFDKKVSPQEFRTARYFEVGLREPPGLDTKAQQALRGRTWKRLVAMEYARRLEIVASDQEIAAIIQRDEAFRRNGIFSREQYGALIHEHFRTDVETFESYLRQDITLRKLASVLQSATWSSPSEITTKLAGITDQFVIEFAELRQSKILPEPLRATLDEARAIYQASPATFMIPERIRVQHVSFAIPPAADMPEPAAAETEAYYQAHSKEYSSIDSNGVVTTLSMDEARSNIVAILREKAAQDEARDHAMTFSLKLQPDRSGKSPTLQELAESEKLTLGTTPLFSKSDVLSNLNVGAAFTVAAFKLDASDPDRCYSEPISGEKAVYVCAPLTREPSIVPPFESVSERAMKLAEEEKTASAFRKKVESVRNAVLASLKTGTSFADALRPYDTAVTTTQPFSVYGESTNNTENIDALKPTIMNLQKGDLTEPVETESAFLLAYIQDRSPGDMLSAEMMRPQLIAAIDQHRAGIVFGEWQDFVMKQAGVKDERPIPDSAASAQTDEP